MPAARHARSTFHRIMVAGLVAIVLAGGLLTRDAANPTPALAFHCPPGQVDVIIGGNLILCVPEGGLGNDLAPDQLLNRGQINGGRHYATVAQQAALAAMMQTAVANTAQTHQVPAAELAAVQTWGRADAQAELWGLVVEAITTAPCPTGVTTDCRTADQQHVVDWMSDMARRQGMETAIAAGLELVKYSGLSQAGYNALFAEGAQPTQETLTAFLTIEPLNYNTTDPATATGGYCIYRAPAPYQSEYTGYNDQTCFTPCSSVLGCDDPMPETEQFIKWGAATWTSGVYNTEEYASATRSISLGVGLGGLATAVVTGVTLATTLGAVLAGTSFTAAVFPFAATVYAVIGSGGFTGAALSATTTAASTAAAGVMAASAVAAIAAAVVLFITGTTIRAIDLFTDLAVPGDIAKAIVDSRTAAYDPATMITDDEDHYTLYQLFVGATVPGPLYETCNNQPRVFPVQAMCLNAPAIPAATAADPQFIVTDHVTATSPASATAISPTISFYTPGIDVRYVTETRLHGTWFIHNLGGPTVQTFRIRFGDWTGAMHTAWLLKKDSGAYTFFGIPDGTCAAGTTCQGPLIVPTTCVADGTCWESSSIKYVGTDGVFHTAAVRSPAAVAWTPPAAITYPAPLTATQLNASAAGVAGTFAYTVDGTAVSASDNRILGGGTHTLGVTFTPAESTGLLPGTATVSLTVNKAALTVTAPTTTMPYGGPVPTLAPQFGPLVNGDDALDLDTPPTCSTGADGDSPVGSYATTCAGGADGDYAYTFVPGTLSVTPAPLTIAAPNVFMTYGDTVPAIEPVYLGLVSDDTASAVTVAPSCSTTATSASPVGSYLTSCTGGTVPNYAVSHQTGTLAVGLRGLAITPDDATKTYGESLAFTGTEFSAANLVNGDTIASLTITSAGASASAQVADSPYVIEGKDPVGTGLTNYLILIGEGELTVERRDLEIAADDAVKTYGETVTFAGTEFTTNGLVNGDTVTAVSLESGGAVESAGVLGSPYVIEPSVAVGSGLANYAIAYVDGRLTVNPALLTLTASSATMVLGGVVPAILPAFSGFVAGDTAQDVSETSCTTTATSASPIGTYPSSCTGGTGANYTTTTVDGVVTVTFDTPALFDQAKAVKSGANLSIKFQLRDASGTNLSSPSIAVSLATPVALTGPGGTAVSRQPTGSFAFTNNRDNGPTYQYDLKTSGLAKGTYTLLFTVGGDPFTHSLVFKVG